MLQRMKIDFASLSELPNPVLKFGSYVPLQFHSLARDKWRPPDPRIPFEYCYDMRLGIII